MVKGEKVGEVMFLKTSLLQKCRPIWPSDPTLEQLTWRRTGSGVVAAEWAGGRSEPLTLHLCCHRGLLGVLFLEKA